jgi:prepilin-type N-terminal cleavage/methylation domain-containing protein/prepilin-type processing-associated H-X9-DG protein
MTFEIISVPKRTKVQEKGRFMQNKYKAGFTLVELLVVISVIAILMGVLLPALTAARARAYTIVCGANLKNYGPALYMYAEANNDKAPFSFSWLYSMQTIFGTGSPTASAGAASAPSAGSLRCPQECRWHYDKDKPDGTLWPYLRNIKSHMCPTFKILSKNAKCPNSQYHPRSWSTTTGWYHPTYSYSMNRWLGFDWLSYIADPTLVTEPSLRLSQVKRTAQCFAFSEENLWSIGDPGNPDSHPKRRGDTKTYSKSVLAKTDLWMYALDNGDVVANFATYHNVSAGNSDEGKANVVFVDGHVAQIRGLAGRDAYLEYGRPFIGHEWLNNGQIW